MKYDINDYIIDFSSSRYKNREVWLIKNHPQLYDKIINYISNYNVIYKQRVYHYYYKLNEIPKCKNKCCNNSTKYSGKFKLGYRDFCCVKCAVNDDKIKNNRLETNLLKYNVKHPFQNENIKEKIKQKNINFFGVDNPMKNDNIVNKLKKNILKKYGVDNFFKTKKFIQNQTIKKRNKYIIYWSNILNVDKSKIIILNNNDVKLIGLCDKHSEFIINKNNLYNRIVQYKINPCTKCNPIGEQSSIKEKELLDFIKSLNVNYIENDRKILNGKELDIYLPDNKIAIEFNGLYWHSDKFKDKNYHLNKTNLCEKQGVQLFHIFEDEWIYKKEIVKSIIKSKLGLIKNNFFARKTVVKEVIDNKLIREFLNKNHIQGFVGSKIKLGLFYENELVSLMTFGKKRKFMNSKSKSEDDYELIRVCNKLNTNIVGGASKLFKYFLRIYKSEETTFCVDRRYDDNNLYIEMGFNFIEKTKAISYIMNAKFNKKYFTKIYN